MFCQCARQWILNLIVTTCNTLNMNEQYNCYSVCYTGLVPRRSLSKGGRGGMQAITQAILPYTSNGPKFISNGGATHGCC